MSRAVVVLTLWGCALAAKAQTTGAIEGRVVLEGSGEPLHHVTILAVPLGRTVQTDDAGYFKFDYLAPGKYELIAHLHALTDERKSVVVAPGQTASVDFHMRFATLREQLTVTASGREETTLESYQPAASLESADLMLQSANSLGELVENQAGVAKRSFGPGSSRPVIRGFDGDRVLIMQDGIRTGSLSSQSGDHGEPVDPNTVERVEVVRGPSTLLYEGNAIGGVVNVISGHHQIHREPHDGLRGFVSALGGSNNNRRSGSGGFEYGRNSWILFANGGGLHTTDYATPAGKVRNSFSDLNNASLGLGRYGQKTYVNFSYAWQDGRYGIPFDPLAEHAEEEEEEHAHHGVVSLPFRRHNFRFNGGLKNLDAWVQQVQLALNYSDWKHSEQEGDQIGTRFENKLFVYRGVFDHRSSRSFSGVFGFWGLTRDYQSIGDEALTPPASQNAFALFAVERWNRERIGVQFGARLEHNRYDPEQLRARRFTGLAASAGMNLRLWEGGALVASAATSFRSPSLEELYARGPHPGNLTFEIGDATLGRERGNGFDLSLRHQSGRLRAEGNFFYYRLSGFVFAAPTAEVEDGFPVAFYRQGSSRYRGAEGRLSAQLNAHLMVHFGADAVNAELRSPTSPLPRIPPVRGRAALEARLGAFSLMPEFVVANRQTRVYELEEPTAGYGLWNVKALYSITSKHFLHLFGVNVFNASNRLYRNHLSFIKSFAPEIGRGVLFSYTLRYF